MYQDTIFENAKREAKEKEFNAIKADVKEVENLIENFLSQLLECTTIATEREFYACGI